MTFTGMQRPHRSFQTAFFLYRQHVFFDRLGLPLETRCADPSPAAYLQDGDYESEAGHVHLLAVDIQKYRPGHEIDYKLLRFRLAQPAGGGRTSIAVSSGYRFTFLTFFMSLLSLSNIVNGLCCPYFFCSTVVTVRKLQSALCKYIYFHVLQSSPG
jgi:hypothetical protein